MKLQPAKREFLSSGTYLAVQHLQEVQTHLRDLVAQLQYSMALLVQLGMLLLLNSLVP